MEVAVRTGQPISEVRALPSHELRALIDVMKKVSDER